MQKIANLEGWREAGKEKESACGSGAQAQ